MKNDESTKDPILNIGKDILIYIPAMLLPALFGFIGLSIYTRVFTPTEYGNYRLTVALYKSWEQKSYQLGVVNI